MNVLDEAKNIVDDKFETKRNVVSQEFRVLVNVACDSKDPAVIRALLDQVSKNFGDFIYADGTGTIQVVQVEPK